MTSIYDQHRDAFANVSAYVVMRGGERVATVALKYPRDGAGRLYAYVHYIGIEMVRGYASGGGYDKRSAACSAAGAKLGNGTVARAGHWSDDEWAAFDAFRTAIRLDDGFDWARNLEKAGFTVYQAV